MKRSFYFRANVTLLATATLGVAVLVSGSIDGDGSLDSPAFSTLPAESLEGETVPLLDSLRATVFLVVMPSCAVAADVVPDWAASLKDSLPHIVRLAILAFDTDGADVVARYLEERQLNIETVIVPHGLFMASTGMTIVPAVILVDETGQVLFAREGKTDASSLREEILGALPVATTPEV